MAGRRATTILAATLCTVPWPLRRRPPRTCRCRRRRRSRRAACAAAARGRYQPPPGDTAPAHQPSRFFPFSLPFGGSRRPRRPLSTPSSAALLDRVSLYLTERADHGRQFRADRARRRPTEGTFYIQKPGKVRFEYNPPSPIDIIADGSSVVVRDRNLATQDLYPLSQTPLRYLLADHIESLHDTDVISVTSDDTFITVVIEEKQVMVGTSRLMIMFDAKDLGAQAMDRHRSAGPRHHGRRSTISTRPKSPIRTCS